MSSPTERLIPQSQVQAKPSHSSDLAAIIVLITVLAKTQFSAVRNRSKGINQFEKRMGRCGSESGLMMPARDFMTTSSGRSSIMCSALLTVYSEVKWYQAKISFDF